MRHGSSKSGPMPAPPKTVVVSVPIYFSRRGGRKTVIGPVPYASAPTKFDNALIKALARAHRWRRMIENGEYLSVTDLAKGEKVNESYACRLLRLTLLAPEIVEAILDGRQPRGLQLNQLLQPQPAGWESQVRQLFHGYSR